MMEKRYTLVMLFIGLLADSYHCFASSQKKIGLFERIKADRMRYRNEKKFTTERTLLDSKDFSKSEKKLWCATNPEEAKKVQYHSLADEKNSIELYCDSSSNDSDKSSDESSVFEDLSDCDLEVCVGSSCRIDNFSPYKVQDDEQSFAHRSIRTMLQRVEFQQCCHHEKEAEAKVVRRLHIDTMSEEMVQDERDSRKIEGFEDIKKKYVLSKLNKMNESK